MKKVTGPAVANFIKENIICHFGISQRILSDNGMPFVNSNVRELLALYDVDHVKLTPYNPKGMAKLKQLIRRCLRC